MNRKMFVQLQPVWNRINPAVESSLPKPYQRVLVEFKDKVFYADQWHTFYAYAELQGPETFWLSHYRRAIPVSRIAQWQEAPLPVFGRMS